jgi:hypothetical protein
MNQAFTTSLGIGTVLQVAMVVVGHFVPVAQRVGHFPSPRRSSGLRHVGAGAVGHHLHRLALLLADEL